MLLDIIFDLLFWLEYRMWIKYVNDGFHFIEQSLKRTKKLKKYWYYRNGRIINKYEYK